MEALMALNSKVNSFVWGPPMLILLVGTGIYLTIRQNWLQVNKFGYSLKMTLGRLREKGEGVGGEVTPFQALATAMAGTIGVGNIAGVATAIASGGPGARILDVGVGFLWYGHQVFGSGIGCAFS
jgi:AGCS family alanine or glycine:cation symporter